MAGRTLKQDPWEGATVIRREVPAGKPAGLLIRPAAAQDVPDIVAIWGELAYHHARLDPAFAPSERWQDEYRQFIRSLLGRDDALAVVAVDGGHLAGYGVGRISILPGFFERHRRGYIHDVVIREAFRRRGIGRRLADALLAWMHDEGVSSVELTVAIRNTEAVAFWEQLGFATYMHHMKRDL